jgi:IMP dehydrogenase
MMSVPAILHGGVSCPAALAKAIAAGAEAVIFGDLFAGTEEAPGEMIWRDGQALKSAKGQLQAAPYRGSVAPIVRHLVDGLKEAMAYTGSADIRSMIETAEFVKK